MDVKTAQAREHHRNAGDASAAAARHRALRDDLVRAVWAGERDRWTYSSLAAAVGCSPELIAKIITGR